MSKSEERPWNAELLAVQEFCKDCGHRCGDREMQHLTDTPKKCPVCGWQEPDQA